MRTRIAFTCLVIFAAYGLAHAAELIDFPLDPVALVGGQETVGKDDLSIEHGPFRYKFADATNKSTFEKDPERYEIQLGGACARMGPLNHAGDVERHALHDGKIYLFASDECRQTFLANPSAMLEADDAPPDVSDESIRRGRELLNNVVVAMGGAERIDAIKTYDDKMYTVAGNDNSYNGLWVAFPNSFSQKFKRNERWWSMTSTGADTAWFDSDQKARTMAKSQQQAFMREMGRLIVLIVKSRNDPKFICSYVGQAEFDEKPVEQIAVALHGSTTTLMIDPKTNQVVGQTYRGRGPRSFLGEYEVTYSDHTTFEGVTLPITWSTKVEGEYIAEFSGTLDEVHFDQAIDSKVFEQPKAK